LGSRLNSETLRPGARRCEEAFGRLSRLAGLRRSSTNRFVVVAGSDDAGCVNEPHAWRPGSAIPATAEQQRIMSVYIHASWLKQCSRCRRKDRQSSAFAAAPARQNDSGYQPSLGYGVAGRIYRLPTLTNNRSSCRNCMPYRYSSGNSCRSSYMRVGLPQTQSRKSPPQEPKREFWHSFSYSLSLLMQPRLAPAKR